MIEWPPVLWELPLYAGARGQRGGGARGGAAAVWIVPTTAPPPTAPALANRLLPPPALLMLLLADMDVVNQVRVPAPRTEPSAAWLPRPSLSGSPDSERWWPGSWQWTPDPGHWGWGLRQMRGGRGRWGKEGVRPLPQQGLSSLPRQGPPQAQFPTGDHEGRTRESWG